MSIKRRGPSVDHVKAAAAASVVAAVRFDATMVRRWLCRYGRERESSSLARRRFVSLIERVLCGGIRLLLLLLMSLIR